MKLTLEPKNPYWWLWIITIGFTVAAIAGWTPGYYAVMAVSALQVILFAIREHSFDAFPVQIRVVYFAATLLGLWPAVRLPFYVLILLATIMAAFFGRCSISLLLKQMPWNRTRPARLY